MKKILCLDENVYHVFANNGQKTGGAAVQLYGWIHGWVENGHDVVVLHHNPGRVYGKQLRFVKSYDANKGLKGLRWLYYRLPTIRKRIESIAPDIIYQGGLGWATFFYLGMAHRLNIPYVIRISNDIYADDRWKAVISNRFKQWLMILALKKCKLMAAQNEYQLQQITKRYPQKNVLKITNPFKSFSAVKAEKKRQYVAWLGLFQSQKNLQALVEIAKDCPQLNFQVAGQLLYKDDQETLAAVKQLEELSNVKMLPFLKRHKVPGFLAGARCLLNTSHYEGFSNTFLEAFSVGTPVVTTKLVNPDGIIGQYHLGLVAENHEQLSACLKKLMNENNAVQMAESCQKYLKEHHDPVILSRQLLEFVKSSMA